MGPLDAAVLVLLLYLPFHWLVARELKRMNDPAYLRRKGVVLVSKDVLEGHSAPIGAYMGSPIWGSVRFKGMEYRFDRVVDRRDRERIRAGELYLDPGLVYVAN
jgi:hypothetical protein